MVTTSRVFAQPDSTGFEEMVPVPTTGDMQMSNRDGIGARIQVITKSGAQQNHMTTSVGYASSSCGPVHFGLGANAMADSVAIHWPSGIVQALKDVGGDRVLRVKETP